MARREDVPESSAEDDDNGDPPTNRWTDLEHLVQVFWVVLAGIGVVLGLFLLPTAITELATQDPLAWAGTAILALVFVGLGAGYFYAATTEKARLQAVAPTFNAPLPSYLPLLVLVMVLTWVALAFAIFWPPVFGLVLTLLKAEESTNAWVAKREIRRGARQLLRDRTLTGSRRWKISVVLDYYFAHPWDPLLALEMLLLATISAIGVYLGATRPRAGDVPSLAVCVAIAAAVALNESVAFVWRSKRNHDIDRPPPPDFASHDPGSV